MAKMKDCSNRGKLMVMIGLLVMAPAASLLFYPQDMGCAAFFCFPGCSPSWPGGLCVPLESGSPISALTA